MGRTYRVKRFKTMARADVTQKPSNSQTAALTQQHGSGGRVSQLVSSSACGISAARRRLPTARDRRRRLLVELLDLHVHRRDVAAASRPQAPLHGRRAGEQRRQHGGRFFSPRRRGVGGESLRLARVSGRRWWCSVPLCAADVMTLPPRRVGWLFSRGGREMAARADGCAERLRSSAPRFAAGKCARDVSRTESNTGSVEASK